MKLYGIYLLSPEGWKLGVWTQEHRKGEPAVFASEDIARAQARKVKGRTTVAPVVIVGLAHEDVEATRRSLLRVVKGAG